MGSIEVPCDSSTPLVQCAIVLTTSGAGAEGPGHQGSTVTTLAKMWQLLVLVLISGVTAEEGPQLWHLSVNGDNPVVHRLANDAQVDVWGHGGDHAKVLVERSAEEAVSRVLREADISHHIEIPDVFTLIEEERKHM